MYFHFCAVKTSAADLFDCVELCASRLSFLTVCLSDNKLQDMQVKVQPLIGTAWVVI